MKRFYRAMSLEEYKNHESLQDVKSHVEWAELEMQKADHRTVKLFLLKKWVDDGSYWSEMNDKRNNYDLIIRVLGVDEEFSVSSTIPLRYVNNVPINFERLEIIYDPRSKTSGEPIKLEDTLDEEEKIFFFNEMGNLIWKIKENSK